jgi:hypothetical protein
MRWTKHAACIREVKNEYNSGRKPEGNYHAGDLGVDGI